MSLTNLTSRQLPSLLMLLTVGVCSGSFLARAEELRIEPVQVHLYAGSTQQLLIAGASESAPDLTVVAEYSSSDDVIATVSRSGVVRGHLGGSAMIKVRAAGQIKQVPVTVASAEDAPEIRFATEVVPILTRLGCNSGGCHGKATGQNGFKLSLFGFEPELDHDALVSEARGRRLFPADPDRSLLLLKATAHMPHGGGRRLEEASDDYRILRNWIVRGAAATARR